MLYIQQSLGPNEEIVHIGEFHWMHDVRAVFNIVFGIVMAIVVIVGAVYGYYQMGKIPPSISMQEAVSLLPPSIKLIAFALFVLGIYSFSRMMTDKATTEMAITNLRIIYKKGLLVRQVAEISVDRIEGVVVHQSLFGRLLDYGQIAVRGMGVGEVILPAMSKPIVFRQAIQIAREKSDERRRRGASEGETLDDI